MKRMTERRPNGVIHVDFIEAKESVMSRLAAIEDILGDEYNPDHLRELAQANREGISPCTFCRFNPPSSCDGKPCCMCPAEAALRREQDGNRI